MARTAASFPAANVSGADKVVVLSEGCVAEQGTPEELLKTGKIYPHMARLQTVSQNWQIS